MGIYVSPRGLSGTSGMGQFMTADASGGQYAGGVSSLTVYASGQQALSLGYGRVYQQNGQYFATGPYGPIQILDPVTVYPDGQSALRAGLGRLYTDASGTLHVTGPKGAIQITSPPNPLAMATPAMGMPDDTSSGGGTTLVLLLGGLGALGLAGWFLLGGKRKLQVQVKATAAKK